MIIDRSRKTDNRGPQTGRLKFECFPVLGPARNFTFHSRDCRPARQFGRHQGTENITGVTATTETDRNSAESRQWQVSTAAQQSGFSAANKANNIGKLDLLQEAPVKA